MLIYLFCLVRICPPILKRASRTLPFSLVVRFSQATVIGHHFNLEVVSEIEWHDHPEFRNKLRDLLRCTKNIHGRSSWAKKWPDKFISFSREFSIQWIDRTVKTNPVDFNTYTKTVDWVPNLIMLFTAMIADSIWFSRLSSDCCSVSES